MADEQGYYRVHIPSYDNSSFRSCSSCGYQFRSGDYFWARDGYSRYLCEDCKLGGVAIE